MFKLQTYAINGAFLEFNAGLLKFTTTTSCSEWTDTILGKGFDRCTLRSVLDSLLFLIYINNTHQGIV